MSGSDNNLLPTKKIENALEIIKYESGNAESYYNSAVLLYNAAIEDNTYESQIEKGINLALQCGLSSTENKEQFINAIYLYSQILLKYKNWNEAFNFLKLSAQIDDESPGWVSNYLAKLYFEINPQEAFIDPHPVLVKLGQGARDLKFRGQSLNIFKDFLLSAQKAFEGIQNIDKRNFAYKQFKDAIKGFLESKSEYLVDFIPSQYKQIIDPKKYDDYSLYDNLDEDFSSENEKSVYSKIIEELKIQLAEENQLVEELTNENLQLHQHINRLENELKDLSHPKNMGEIKKLKKDRLKILILGGSRLKSKDMIGILKSYGIKRDNVTILDYDETKRYNIDKLKFNSPYSGILVGPVAHKVVGIENYSSLLDKLKKEKGFPATIEIRSKSGGLKITKTSFKTALSHLFAKIRSIDPELTYVNV